MLIASVALYASCSCGCADYKATWDIRVTYLDGKTEDKTIVIEKVQEDATLVLLSDADHPTPCIVMPVAIGTPTDVICGVREFTIVKERKEKMTPAEQEQSSPGRKSKSPLL